MYKGDVCLQVWVLTGDKEETAVNISYSAGHFNADMIEVRLTKQRNAKECEETLKNIDNVYVIMWCRGLMAVKVDNKVLNGLN